MARKHLINPSVLYSVLVNGQLSTDSWLDLFLSPPQTKQSGCVVPRRGQAAGKLHCLTLPVTNSPRTNKTNKAQQVSNLVGRFIFHQYFIMDILIYFFFFAWIIILIKLDRRQIKWRIIRCICKYYTDTAAGSAPASTHSCASLCCDGS